MTLTLEIKEKLSLPGNGRPGLVKVTVEGHGVATAPEQATIERIMAALDQIFSATPTASRIHHGGRG